MSLRAVCRSFALFLLTATLAAGAAHAQSVCVGPLLGDGGVEEICAHVFETGVGGATADFRGPSPLAIGPVTVGDYDVNVVLTYASNGGGMALLTNGTVTRTNAGTEGIVIEADAGLGTPLPATSGSLTLIGDATDISETMLGGAAGHPAGADVFFTGFGGLICDETTLGAQPFDCLISDRPVAEGAVAVKNITTFHLNNVGQSINIPSGSVVGAAPLIGVEAMLLEIDIDGVRELFPSDQFLLEGSDANCNDNHWHTLFGSATALSGAVFIDNMGCGAGKENQVPVFASNEIMSDTEMPVDQDVGDGEALAVRAPNTLMIPSILTLTNESGGTLGVEFGAVLDVQGTVVNEPGGLVSNAGTIVNAGNTIHNRGTFVNTGTIDNTAGTFTNECGGVFDDRGTLIGNAVIEVPCPGKQQIACATALNKSFGKVASTKDKSIGKCFKDFAKGGASADGCVASLDAKVDKAEAKTISTQAKKCGGAPMGFGPTDGATINAAAVSASQDVALDVFGATLDTALLLLSADKDGAKCQAAAQKQIAKCTSILIKEFNKCKKGGLKKGTILDESSLAECMGADPKGKFGKACDPVSGKLAASVLQKKCVGKGVDLLAAFPGCATADAGMLAACAEASVRCRACLALDAADDLAVDCDAFDDGQANVSCP